MSHRTSAPRASLGPPPPRPLVPPQPVNSGRLERERQSYALIGHMPHPSPPLQVTGGLAEHSEDEGSLHSRLHDLGRRPACGGEGTGKEELGGMTHPSPRFLPTSRPRTEREKPLLAARGLAEGLVPSPASAFGLQLWSPRRPLLGEGRTTEESALLLPPLAPHPGLGFCTVAGTFSPAQEPAEAGPCTPASGDPMVQAVSPGRSQLFVFFSQFLLSERD